MKKNQSWTKKMLTLLSMIILGSHIMHLMLIWTNIPDRIAIHFTNGVPDNWGSKFFLLIVPVLGLLTWWLLELLTKNPAKFKYINLTEKNRDKQYEMSGKIMAIHQNVTLIAFVLLNESFVRSAIGTDDNIFFILFIVSLIVMLLVILYNVIWAARLKE